MYGMSVSPRLAAKSLESAVYDAVRERIISGHLRPGDPLVEAQLSEEFGISKTPVREALISLGRDGLVEQAPYKKSKVATPTADDVRQACEVRRWLESEIAAQIARAPRNGLVERLERNVAASRQHLADGDLDACAATVHEFSDILLEASSNKYAAMMLERLRNVLALIANVAQTEPGRRERSISQHEAILDAIRAENEERAREATLAHMDSIETDSLHALDLLTAPAPAS
jgi:DNA-binding GntR family transcriptional regulator